jgi:hypothetical protein
VDPIGVAPSDVSASGDVTSRSEGAQRRAAVPDLCDRLASKQKCGCRAGRVGPIPATEEIAVSESTQGRPDEADEKAPQPGEQDTETVAGQPKKAPKSKDGEQSKQDQ